MTTIYITPDPQCPECHGSGRVNDWMDMPNGAHVDADTPCDCVLTQLSKQQLVDLDLNIELDLSDGVDTQYREDNSGYESMRYQELTK